MVHARRTVSVHPVVQRIAIGALLFAAVGGAGAIIGCNAGDAGTEGETRPLRKEGRAGIFMIEGTERFHDGEWLKHGDFVFRDDRDEVISRGRYVDGFEDGPWTQTYEGGAKGQGSFTEGRRSGEWITFHRNGSQQDKGRYERGQRVGSWTSFRADKSLLRVAEYKAGKLEGLVVWYEADGKTVDQERSGTYRKGERSAPLPSARR